MSAGPDLPDRPLNLRPSRRPRLVRALQVVLFVGCALAVAGLPVLFFMHSSATGWQDARVVTASVADDARCRTGPPPGEPRTCTATWDGGGGDVSNRYGGPAPAVGEDVEARVVGDDLALTGYRGSFLAIALASPYVAGLGLLLGAVAVAGLLRYDPRWWSRRSDLPTPGRGPLDQAGRPAATPPAGGSHALSSGRAPAPEPPPRDRRRRRGKRSDPGRHRLHRGE